MLMLILQGSVLFFALWMSILCFSNSCIAVTGKAGKTPWFTEVVAALAWTIFWVLHNV